MENKLPEKYENSFFSKIKRFFSNIFRKKNISEEHIQVAEENKKEIVAKENEFDKMKVASNKVKLKEDILALIDKNPKLIDSLPLERLKELDAMYDEIIKENDRKINKLKREVA